MPVMFFSFSSKLEKWFAKISSCLKLNIYTIHAKCNEFVKFDHPLTLIILFKFNENFTRGNEIQNQNVPIKNNSITSSNPEYTILKIEVNRLNSLKSLRVAENLILSRRKILDKISLLIKLSGYVTNFPMQSLQTQTQLLFSLMNKIRLNL